MVKVEKLSKSYADNRYIIENLDLEIKEEEFTAILGPSGCGKTTLLNMLAGFITPTRGRLYFRGKEINKPSPERAVVFQDSNLFPWLNVKKNVLFGLNQMKMAKDTANETADYFLNLVGMKKYKKYYPHTLSGGMKQRVAIARVLALEPGLLLMDEPFSALDSNSRENLQDELLRIGKNHKKTIIYITHSVEEAAYLGDRIIIMGEMSGNIFFDERNPLKKPVKRSSTELKGYTEFLRGQMRMLPCCIKRTG